MKLLLAAALIAASTPVAAEVVRSSPHGFEIRHTIDVPLQPQAALAAFEKVAAWWEPDHTYSGKSENLRLTLAHGSCFCEVLPNGGGVEHMRVSFFQPGERVVLTGSLGPLLYEATTGVMDVQVKPARAGSQLILNYRTAGFFNGGADKLAAPVDGVLGTQMRRLADYARRAR